MAKRGFESTLRRVKVVVARLTSGPRLGWREVVGNTLSDANLPASGPSADATNVGCGCSIHPGEAAGMEQKRLARLITWNTGGAIPPPATPTSISIGLVLIRRSQVVRPHPSALDCTAMPKFDSWRQRGAARRSTRQAPASTDVAKLRGSRDTKRWCRGKPGVEHKPIVATRSELGKASWDADRPLRRQSLVRYCADCGKELDSFYQFGGEIPFMRLNEPPQWALDFFAEREKKKTT